MTPRLVLVTDRRALAPGRALEDVIAAALGALPAGAAWLQLREKDLDEHALAALGRRLVPVCRTHATPLVINGPLEVALAIDADGVHLPDGGDVAAARQRLGPARLLGRSTHSARAAIAAAQAGADLVMLGTIWPTPSKAGLGEPLGLEAVTAAVRGLGDRRTARLCAIGGIDGPDRARAARAAGADAVAVIRAVMAADDPAAAAAALHAALL